MSEAEKKRSKLWKEYKEPEVVIPQAYKDFLKKYHKVTD